MPDANLALFMTQDVSLRSWDDTGLLARELALYRKLSARLASIRIVTHGDAGDLRYKKSLAPITITCNRLGLPPRIYRNVVRYATSRFWPRDTIVKTNQMAGADFALQTARINGFRLIARCGYLHSRFIGEAHGADSAEARTARALEREVFGAADAVIVTTDEMKHTVNGHYGVCAEKIFVVPNYVDTDIFRPDPGVEKNPKRLVTIARLSPQKNLAALLEAVRPLDIELKLIGTGELEADLRRRAAGGRCRVEFMGNVPSRAIPGILNAAGVFVLPSLYEGHPKALIEAMACGLCVIGSKADGIRELIDDGRTGFVCATDPGSIRAAIETALPAVAQSGVIGENARRYAFERFALEKVVDKEVDVYRYVMDRA